MKSISLGNRCLISASARYLGRYFGLTEQCRGNERGFHMPPVVFFDTLGRRIDHGGSRVRSKTVPVRSENWR